MFRQAFDTLGGADWLVDFATRSDSNARCFVQCVSKLLPQNIEMVVNSVKLDNMTEADLHNLSIAELSKFVIDGEYETVVENKSSPIRRIK